MAVEKVTHLGFFGTLKESIKRVATGFGLLMLAPLMLFWNECRSVQTAKSLEEGAGTVVSVESASVDGKLDGKLVHTSGEATTAETLRDSEFQIMAQGFRMRREVEMYQWVENESTRTENDKKITTFTYEKRWDSSLHDSDDFEEISGHLNPSSIPYEGKEYQVTQGSLGAFTLDDDEISKLSNFEQLPVSAEQAALSGGAAKEHQGRIYIGADPSNPSVGDVRITFEVVPVGPMSIVGKQVGSGFAPYQTQAGDALLMVTPTLKSAEQMFEDAKNANIAMTWGLRFFGFMLIAAGFGAIFGPLKVIADRIPLVGGILEGGIGLLSFLLAVVVTFFVIALAWIVARPLLGVLLLLVGIGGIVGIVMLAMKAKKAKGDATPAPEAA
ncbi:MAG: TMEM43 family protein [Myxococcota bacterium]|nr:TMEM43 family protein [Myxococcota bacterium]